MLPGLARPSRARRSPASGHRQGAHQFRANACVFMGAVVGQNLEGQGLQRITGEAMDTEDAIEVIAGSGFGALLLEQLDRAAG